MQTQYLQVPTCITLHNSSSCNAQLSQLDDFSFCDSFDESCIVYLVQYFPTFTSLFFFFSTKEKILSLSIFHLLRKQDFFPKYCLRIGTLIRDFHWLLGLVIISATLEELFCHGSSILDSHCFDDSFATS